MFVFAIQTAKTHEAYDPLEVDQWEFRVLPAHKIIQDSLGYPDAVSADGGGDLRGAGGSGTCGGPGAHPEACRSIGPADQGQAAW